MLRKTPLRKRRSKPRTHKFIVRLTGMALLRLRHECWCRDGGKCTECGIYVRYYAAYDGDPEAFDMAHIKSRGACGSDTLENVRTLCHRCHMLEHSRGKRKQA